MRTYKIHIIRHGITQANLDGRFIGNTDDPLCNQGISQLYQLKQNNYYPDVQKVFSSPAERCLQTGDILFPDVFTVVHSGLCEMDLGIIEGELYDEVKDDPDFKLWIEDAVANPLPESEPYDTLMQRIVGTIQSIFTEMMENQLFSVGIITHSSIITHALAGLGYPKFSVSDISVDSGKGYTLLFTPELWMRDSGFEIFARVPQSKEALHQQWLNERYGDDQDDD